MGIAQRQVPLSVVSYTEGVTHEYIPRAQISLHYARFEFFKAMKIQVVFFHCLHLHPEEGGSMVL